MSTEELIQNIEDLDKDLDKATDIILSMIDLQIIQKKEITSLKQLIYDLLERLERLEKIVTPYQPESTK